MINIDEQLYINKPIFRLNIIEILFENKTKSFWNEQKFGNHDRPFINKSKILTLFHFSGLLRKVL